MPQVAKAPVPVEELELELGGRRRGAALGAVEEAAGSEAALGAVGLVGTGAQEGRPGRSL